VCAGDPAVVPQAARTSAAGMARITLVAVRDANIHFPHVHFFLRSR
jgi:hypothetical protein